MVHSTAIGSLFFFADSHPILNESKIENLIAFVFHSPVMHSISSPPTDSSGAADVPPTARSAI